MLLTITAFEAISGRMANENMISALHGLQKAGALAGLAKPHRLAMFLGQTAHESGNWQWDREIWGPTIAQKGYEGRKDLGNTEPGDGNLFRGYTPMQITGRYNTTKFYKWCVLNYGAEVPDFTKQPHLMNTDPWEGIGPIWYWIAGKPKSLNLTADTGDYRRVTYLINGGYTHLNDRYKKYGRAALFLLDRDPDDLKSFQRKNKLAADGVCGPKTAALLHNALIKLPEVKFNNVETKPSLEEKTGVVSNICRYFGICRI